MHIKMIGMVMLLAAHVHAADGGKKLVGKTTPPSLSHATAQRELLAAARVATHARPEEDAFLRFVYCDECDDHHYIDSRLMAGQARRAGAAYDACYLGSACAVAVLAIGIYMTMYRTVA